MHSYIAHFIAKMHKVEDCELGWATSALRAGLIRGPFLHSFTKNKPKDHAELLARANKYIQVKDLDECRHELKTLLEPQPPRKEQRDDQKQTRSRKKLLPRRPEAYIPLNASLSQILDQSKGGENFKWPGRLKGDPHKRDKSKYCDFHKDHGHTTDECKALKYEVEELIK